jgi:hypothetical protein
MLQAATEILLRSVQLAAVDSNLPAISVRSSEKPLVTSLGANLDDRAELGFCIVTLAERGRVHRDAHEDVYGAFEVTELNLFARGIPQYVLRASRVCLRKENAEVLLRSRQQYRPRLSGRKRVCLCSHALVGAVRAHNVTGTGRGDAFGVVNPRPILGVNIGLTKSVSELLDHA